MTSPLKKTAPLNAPEQSTDTGVATPLLEIQDLEVNYRTRSGLIHAVSDVSFSLDPGETLAVVGESGSGKSTTAAALVGLLAANAQIAGGEIRFEGADLRRLSERRIRSLRGREIGYVPQDPTVSLNPVKKVGDQVAEVLRIHRLADRKQAKDAAVQALRDAGLRNPEQNAEQYPHELSGGMRQRVLIAIAIAANPRLIIADEPTSALDVTVARQILDQITELSRHNNTSVLLITHDLGVAADRADRILVMSQGRIVESGSTAQILGDPAHRYTQGLIAAAPSLSAGRPRIALRAAIPIDLPDTALGTAATTRRGVHTPETPSPTTHLIDHSPENYVVAQGLIKEFRLPGTHQKLRAVDDVSFSIPRGHTYALVGESGSGKSTTARLILRLTDVTEGRVEMDGSDITNLSGRALRLLRRKMQIIYQNPYTSLDPRLSVEQIVAAPLRAFSIGSAAAQRARAAELIDTVALPATSLRRKPAELSGGQRQRVAIARALAVRPELVVCDEPVSALDVSIQAQILDLLVDLQVELGVSYLFISHDLAVVRQIAHQVAVMKAGRIVEHGSGDEVFLSPQHPYTQELLASIPGRHDRAPA